jgi:hypothetical protein
MTVDNNDTQQVQEESSKKDLILKTYADLVKQLRRPVKMNDMIDAGFTKDMVSHHFQSLTRLSDAARAVYPDNFHDVDIATILSPKAIDELNDAVKNYKRFVITTAVTGCYADESLLKSIQHYCQKNDAAHLVLIASDPAHNRDFAKDHGSVARSIVESGAQLVVQDTALNTNLYLSTIKLSAKHIDPITGLGRIGQRNGSFIYASPKQRLKPVAVSNEGLPHFMMTTGAITISDYSTENYMSERTAYIADNDHIMGGLIVEIVDEDRYHFRQFQSDADGSFIDFGVQYNADGTTEVQAPVAFVLGDWHSGETDATAARAWIQIANDLKVENVVLHDAFDGLSINHHEMDNIILRAQRSEQGQLDLKSELAGLANDINMWTSIVPKVTIVKSNHDEFLELYLRKGWYVQDPQNHRIALHLSLAMLDNLDPLRYGVENLGLENKDRVTWLARDEDFRIARIQLGAHGDKGANGSRGSLRAMEGAYGNSVSGHSHSPEILRGAWQVGTSSKLKLSYNKGPSSWLHTSCLVYGNGSRQLINVIEGQYRL